MNNDLDAGRRALHLMTEALAALDESALPADIGAHLDMAIVRLGKHVDSAKAGPEGRTYAVG